MNERINRLLSQAYDQAVPETWTELSSEQLGRIYDKFAELNVRECAEVAGCNGHVSGFSLAVLIQEHFGFK